MTSFLTTEGTLVDARSPAEYLQGHIPSAINIPLLDNSERALVGTCYKQKGHNAAVELGFDLAGPKMGNLVRAAKNLPQPLKIYCWRGGLRSQTLSWILATSGMSVQTMKGGYKAFRRSVLDEFKKPRSIAILAGFTGSGKTETLISMRNRGEQVLDLEALANHRGSTFGGIGLGAQPTSEQFENRIATALFPTDPVMTLWIEDESRMIGTCKIPDELYAQMQLAPLTMIEKSREERLQRILHEYGGTPQETLIDSLVKIKKRIGGQREAVIKNHILNKDLASGFSLLMDYYDEKYAHSIKKRNSLLV